MQMDSRSHRILRSSLVELLELHKESVYSNQENYARALAVIIQERKIRFDSGEFYTYSGDSGTEADSDGGEQG